MFRGLVFAGLLAFAPSLALAQQPCTTDARKVVDELYRHMLERTADAGSQAWVDRLNSGMTVRELVRTIAKSPEHLQRFFNATSQDSVGNMYRHLLGRQPDAGGLQAMTNLAGQSGREAVIDRIIDSQEYRQNLGDWGVPGSGGVVFCGNTSNQTAAAQSSSAASSGTAEMRWSGLDRNRNGVIERSEWRGNNRSFVVHDWNGDGVLSGDEVRVGAEPPRGSLAYEDYTMNASDRFDYLDVNDNNYVERNEWDGSLDTFYELDRNGDNRITRAELNRGRRATFAALDVNGDNRITLGEWQWSHRSFDDMDDDQDGAIEPHEFRAGAVPTSGR